MLPIEILNEDLMYEHILLPLQMAECLFLMERCFHYLKIQAKKSILYLYSIRQDLMECQMVSDLKRCKLHSLLSFMPKDFAYSCASSYDLNILFEGATLYVPKKSPQSIHPLPK